MAGDTHKRRLIVNLVGSNLVLADRKLTIDAQKPFRRWSETSTYSELCAFVEDIRTLLLQQKPETVQMIAAIQELLPEATTERKAA
jgi:hypothetical protein